jgi:hypothetical protein
MFDIISMGEYTLLADAFNGLAMIFNSGPIANMMKLAFLVGILVFGFKAAFFTKWDATPLLAGLIGYLCMFGPKVTVTITDGYSGAVRVVANVPVGIAAPMGVTSHTGRFFAYTFEQAFAVITPTDSYFTEGYLNSLEVLLKMRAPSLGWASVSTNNRVEATLMNYLKDCVYLDLAMNDPSNPSEVDAVALTTAKNTWGNLKTTFINVYTNDYLNMPGNQPQSLSCADVYNRLDAQIGSLGTWISTYYDNYLQTQMAASRQAFATSAQDRVGNALAAINLNSSDARTWMMNTMLSTALRNADSAYQVGQNNIAGTVMVTQAASQRNTKWAAEKSMFEQVARPITAFIEMFMVGAAPIMAFAIAAFGPTGFSILGKFLLMHVWVTLWIPTSVLVNAYMMHTMAKYVEWVQYDRGVELLSQSGLDQLNSQLQTQFATGGMLAAAVPMLTLMLIYGSSQVATQLASQMRGSEYIDPKIASPDLVQPGPYVTQASNITQNPGTLTQQTTGAALPSTTIGSQLESGASLAKSNAYQNAAAASNSVNERYGLTEGSNDTLKYGIDGRLSGTGTISQGISAVYNKALSAAQESGVSGQAATNYAMQATDNYRSSLSGGWKANLGTPDSMPFGSISVGGGNQWTSETAQSFAKGLGMSESQLRSANTRFNEGASKDERINAGFEEGRARSEVWGKSQDYTTGKSKENARAISNSLTQTQTAATTFQTLDAARQSLGMSASAAPTQLPTAWKKTFGEGDGWINQTNSDWAKFHSDKPDGDAPAARSAAQQRIKDSGMLKSSGMSLPKEQDALEKLWAMASDPVSAPAFVQSLGKVSGINTGSTGSLSTSQMRSEVPQGGLSNVNMIKAPGQVRAEGQDIQEKVSGGLKSAAGQAAAWANVIKSDFSPKALRSYYEAKTGDVNQADADFRTMASLYSEKIKAAHPADRAALFQEIAGMSPDYLKAELINFKEDRNYKPENGNPPGAYADKRQWDRWHNYQRDNKNK